MALGDGSAAGASDAPGGLIASSSTLAHVRALYVRRHEREPTRAVTIIEDWRLTQDKLTGSLRLYRLGNDEREVTTFGAWTSEAGVHAGTRWQQTRNGLTYLYPGVHEERDALSERALLHDADERDVHLIGESVPYSAYVVEVNPPGGRHEWVFIDKRSGNVVRREYIEKQRRYTTTYEDYHVYDGFPEASRVRTLDAYGNERDQVLLSRTVDLTPDPNDVAIPPSRRTLVEFPYGVTIAHLPVRFVDGLLVTHVRIGGHGYDFLLDSGAAGIVIDPAVVDDNHFDTYGSHVGATIGPFSETTTVVPLMQIGALRLQRVVTRVVAVPFRLDDQTHVAGLIGFDFFADTVVHVDIDHGIVDAIAPGAFHAWSDLSPVALGLDDRTPAVRARVGSALGRIVLDTGANRSVFTTPFALRADVALDPNAALSRFHGMGGTGVAETAHARNFELAGIALSDPVVDVSSADLGAEDIDGTAGTDVLRSYDLYFDYHGEQLYVRRSHHPVD